tara:strand:+ start:34 stop:630 length:597 start_codon:yes stop_codon:yes gene_type:complete
MSSIIRADTIQDLSGNNIINESGNTITIGASGDTTNIVGTLQNNGASVGGANTPAFMVAKNSSTTITRSTNTKLILDREILDTDNAHDTSTGKFQPQTAGKYYVYAKTNMYGNQSTVNNGGLKIYFNGSEVAKDTMAANSNAEYVINLKVETILTFNGSSDYAEIYADIDGATNNTFYVIGHSTIARTYFGGYKLIGA